MESPVATLASSSKGRSWLISPLSVDSVLGVMALGASGNAKQVLDSYLGVNSRQDLIMLLDKVYAIMRGKQTRGATALFVQESIALLPEFRAASDPYAGTVNVKSSDFAGSTRDVNDIIRDGSGIDNMVTCEDVRTVAMGIANGLGFFDTWDDHYKFKSKLTTNCDFKLESGKVIRIPTMHLEESMMYFVHPDGSKGVQLDLNHQARFYVVSGKPSTATLSDFFLDGSLPLVVGDVNLALPRFEFMHEVPVDRILKESGFESLYQRNYFDMNPFLALGTIKQKVSIVVDENGVRATAETIASMHRQSMCVGGREKQIVEIKFEEPFHFAIVSKDGVTLFEGFWDGL